MSTHATLEGIQACVFDAYGTLFDFAAAADRCRDRLGEKAEQLTALWRTKQLEYSWLVSLRGDYVDFWHITGQSLDYAMAALAIEDPALRGRLMECYFVLDAYADARQTLAQIRASKLKCAILSNGSPSMLTAAVSNAALAPLLDEVISVDAAGIYKPHPSVYRLAVDRLQVPAGNICFVSANGWDVSGAAYFGFRVVWLNRVNAVAERLAGAAECRIRSLSELPALLGL